MSWINVIDYQTPTTSTQVEHHIKSLRAQLREAIRSRDYFRTELIAADTKLNDAENAVDKLIEATGGLTVEFQFQGTFTVAVLVDPISERVFTGCTRCCPGDTYNAEIGKAISLGRAMASRGEYFAKAAYGK